MSQSQSLANNEDDLVTLVFMLFGGIATGHQLLAAGDSVVIPFVDGIGFGWPQIVVAAGIIIVGALLLVGLRRRSRDRV